jgi:tRNA (cmo5U34)-methyltransferase
LQGQVDTGYAPDRWEFDDEVTRVFDDMLSRSIPQYRVMRDAVSSVALRFARDGTWIVDLGSSRGEAVAPLVKALGARCYYMLTEVSEPMLVACRERYKGFVDSKVMMVNDTDLRTDYPALRASVTLSVLTMCFIPMNYRQKLLRNVWRHTMPGGAFVMVEKVLGGSAVVDEMMVDVYHGLKHEHGYGWDEIERKKLSLEGVLVPVTAGWNEQLLRQAGFSQVDCFWRWMNFAAWVAVKDESPRQDPSFNTKG